MSGDSNSDDTQEYLSSSLVSLEPGTSSTPLIYSWMKNNNTMENTCQESTPTQCMYNSVGQPVFYCSLKRNVGKDICKYYDITPPEGTPYTLLGCYTTPDCGGNVPNSPITTTRMCPASATALCGTDQPPATILQNCVRLHNGAMPDLSSGANTCYLGVYGQPGFDPCGLSKTSGGNDLCPHSCLTKESGCCPGSF